MGTSGGAGTSGDPGTSSGGTSGTSSGGTSGAPSGNAGKVDPSFGTGGIAKQQPNAYVWEPGGGIVTKDGRIIVVGAGHDQVGNSEIVIGKFQENGKLDPEFGTPSSIKLGRGSGAPENWRNPIVTVERPDGNLVFHGYGEVASAKYGIVQAVNLADNKTCPSVYTTNCYRVPNSTYFERPIALSSSALDASGNLYVAGTGTVSEADFALQKLKAADGFPDTTFGDTTQGVGLAHTDFGGDEGIALIDVQGDGSVIATGVTTAAAKPGVCMAKYSASGQLVAGFGTGGKVLLGVPAQRFAKVKDGKILAVAKVAGKTSFARINPDGTMDTTFGPGGVVTAAFTPKAGANIMAVAILSDNRIVVGYDDFTVGRFSENGVLDTAWNGNGFAAGGVPDGISLYAVGVQPGDKVIGLGGRGKGGDFGDDRDVTMYAVRFQN